MKKMIQLSQRLQAVANLVGETGVVADIGTDHGYIPVYLVSSGKAEQAIAMDVNPGPLQRALEHIGQFHLQERIETRLSDGVKALQPGEAQAIVIAGMGGALMTRILSEGEEVAHMAKPLVLQPQSELSAFRHFLAEHGYRILEEDMVYEDGKFYSMMAASWVGRAGSSTGAAAVRAGQMTEPDYKYGPLLLAGRHPVLRQYLLQQRMQKYRILENLGKNARQDVSGRRAQLLQDLQEIEGILELW